MSMTMVKEILTLIGIREEGRSNLSPGLKRTRLKSLHSDLKSLLKSSSRLISCLALWSSQLNRRGNQLLLQRRMLTTMPVKRTKRSSKNIMFKNHPIMMRISRTRIHRKWFKLSSTNLRMRGLSLRKGTLLTLLMSHLLQRSNP
jgi:hypothetical protein